VFDLGKWENVWIVWSEWIIVGRLGGECPERNVRIASRGETARATSASPLAAMAGLSFSLPRPHRVFSPSLERGVLTT
jgi:hypothetical protein